MQQELQSNKGIDDFKTLRETNCYYVDKTRFIRPVLSDPSRVELFTRPRRFGKTLTMSMLRCFFGIEGDAIGPSEEQRRLFEGLEIMRDASFVERNMGQHPVILISLKGVQGLDFGAAVRAMAGLEASVAAKFDFLKDSPRLDDLDKETFEILRRSGELQKEENSDYLEGFLLMLSTLLCKHFGRQAMVLIDEYDVPLTKAHQNGFHSRMADFYAKFLGLLKTDGTAGPVSKIIMTGCLRVARNQIFTGANNFTPYTVVSQGTIFSTLFGFTPKETADYLAAFGLSGCLELVREHYDGYLFDGDEIFNPWDVAKFVAAAMEAREKAEFMGRKWSAEDAGIAACNYWLGSESTNTTAIKDYVGTLSREDNQRLQELSDGREVEVGINDSMNYDSLSRHNATDMWSLLLHTGYLTATRVVSGDRCVVKIPNLEIKECFDKSIMASFEETVRHDNSGARLARALLSGDAASATRIIQDLFKSYICLHALASRSRPEIFYEAMLSTLLSTCNGSEIDNLKVEPESGDGYADTAFTSYGGNSAAVVELKVQRAGGRLTVAASEAVRQIVDRNYAEKFVDDPDVETVTAVGIAFCKRICRIKTKTLKGGGIGADRG